MNLLEKSMISLSTKEKKEISWNVKKSHLTVIALAISKKEPALN
jgi:hypothetical protein